MVRTKQGGGSGEKQERGEGEVSREGGGTYWWGSKTRKAIGGHWHRLVFMIYFCSVLMSFVAVHCALLSVICLCLSHIVKLFGVAGLVFGVG